MKTLHLLNPKVWALMLLLFCSTGSLFAQTKPNEPPVKSDRTRSNVLRIQAGKANHSLPLNAISVSVLLDSSRVNQNPVQLSYPVGQFSLPDSLGYQFSASLKAETSSGNWRRIFAPNSSKNQN